MLIHPWDSPADTAEVVSFVRAQGFGHLIAPGTRDVPVVVPTQYILGDAAAEMPDVLLHLARPNPVWAALEESSTVLLSVAGDWAYVPSAWKAVGDEDPALGIPTTYYAAAQLLGDAEVLDDDEAKLDVLRRQLAVLEPDIAHADPSVHLRRLPGIRAIRIRVREVAGKFKYGGNVDAAHRAAVAANLEAAVGHLRRRSPDLSAAADPSGSGAAHKLS
ncbi:MAG TPA: FMN-binding negative transcriptional regulator [Mycobacteriales bacterium]|nr:FMN-binding negative transcriptional regulator [Mycobacteriales bacterium]